MDTLVDVELEQARLEINRLRQALEDARKSNKTCCQCESVTSACIAELRDFKAQLLTELRSSHQRVTTNVGGR
ncbi:hypothetical protein EBU95_17955 [bacterium]|nr:hypothetical protein [bacterium]